MQALH